MTTVNISTIGDSGDYATIALWEAATDNDLVSLDRIEVGELLNQTHAVSTAVTFTGATTDATRYRILRAASGAEYDPARGTGALISATTAASPFNLREEGFRLCNVGIRWANATPTGSAAAILVASDATNSNGVAAMIDGCFLSASFTTANNNRGIRYLTAVFPLIMRNTIVAGDGGTTSFIFGIEGDFVAGSQFHNCVAYRLQFNGFDLDTDVAFELKNCVAVGSGGDDFDFNAGSSNIIIRNIASEDTTAVGKGALTGIKAHRAFIAAPLNDFRPQADGPLHEAGVNLSASFTQDITQNAYGAKWNIGPYGQSVRNGNSRANDTRILQVVFASGVDWAFIDTRGYDYMLIYPIGGVGTDPTSGTITFGAFAVDSEFAVSDITDPGERASWASMPNIAGIHRQATMTSTAVNSGYMKVLPTRILLWASGGSGWSNVPVRVELHRANEHWTEAGRG